MANINVTVTGRLLNSAGAAVTSAVIKAVRQQDPLLASTMATADIINATSHASTGAFSITLVGSDTVPVSYKVNLPDGQYFYLRIPAQTLSIGLGDLVTSSSRGKTVRDITPQLRIYTHGVAVASASAIVPTGDTFHVTGTTSITSVTATYTPPGTVITIIFDASLTFTDGNNLKLAGNFSATADDTITLRYDGTNWYEMGRSVN